MSSTQKATRDYVYLIIIATQLLGMLVLDLVEFYPESLWKAPGTPLHFTTRIRELYVANMGDPFFAAEVHEPWFKVLLASEGLIQLPLCAYLVYQLSSRGPAKGPTELAALVLGTIVSITSTVCCYEVWCMGPERVAQADKLSLLAQSYLPFAIVPGFMAVDMYLRILRRFVEAPGKAKTQ